MGSLFGRFINVVPKESPWSRHQDITQHSLDSIAKDLQVRLRSRIDTGVDLASAIRANNLTVRNEAGQFIIQSDAPDQDEIDRTERISDLFQPNAQEPYIDQNKMIFREVNAREMQRRNEETIKNSLEETMYLRFKQSIDDAVRDVVSKHPELLK